LFPSNRESSGRMRNQVRKAMVMRDDILKFHAEQRAQAPTSLGVAERAWQNLPRYLPSFAKLRSGVESFSDLDGAEESRLLGIWEAFGTYLPESQGLLDVAWQRTATSVQLLLRPFILLTVGERQRTTGTGFVIFNSFQAKVACNEVYLADDHRHLAPPMSTSLAPGRADIIWNNITKSPEQIEVRAKFVQLCMSVLLLFWWAIVVWCSSTPQLLHFIFPNLLDDDDEASSSDSWLVTLATEYLPVLIILILLSINPPIMAWIGEKYIGFKTRSELQAFVMGNYLLFQLANIYVGVTAVSILDSIRDITRRPSKVLRFLTYSLPRGGEYLLLVIIIKTGALPLWLLRLWEVFRRVAFSNQGETDPDRVSVIAMQRQLNQQTFRDAVKPFLRVWQFVAAAAPHSTARDDRHGDDVGDRDEDGSDAVEHGVSLGQVTAVVDEHGLRARGSEQGQAEEKRGETRLASTDQQDQGIELSLPGSPKLASNTASHRTDAPSSDVYSNRGLHPCHGSCSSRCCWWLLGCVEVFTGQVVPRRWRFRLPSANTTKTKPPNFQPIMSYEWIYPSLQVCIAIAFLQWVIVPVIVPFAAVFFFLARFIFGFIARYWNDTTADESGGRKWFFKVWNSTTLALLIAEGGLGLYFGFRQAVVPAIVQLLLFVIVSTFRANLRQTFESRQAVLTYVQAIKKDEKDSLAQQERASSRWSAEDKQAGESNREAIEDMDYQQPGRRDALEVKELRRKAHSGVESLTRRAAGTQEQGDAEEGAVGGSATTRPLL